MEHILLTKLFHGCCWKNILQYLKTVRDGINKAACTKLSSCSITKDDGCKSRIPNDHAQRPAVGLYSSIIQLLLEGLVASLQAISCGINRSL